MLLLRGMFSLLLTAEAPDPPTPTLDRAQRDAGLAGTSGAIGLALFFVRTHLSLAATSCETFCATGENLVGAAAAPFAVVPYVLAPRAGVSWARARAPLEPRRSLALGLGLLAGGVAVAGSSAFLYTHPAAARRDGMHWGGASLLAAGVTMTWVGAGVLGYAAAARERRRAIPMASPTAGGFSIGVRGRF